MSDIVEQILELKKQRNALILAHYYVADAVQQIADYVGDSYYLSKIASSAPERTIVFCGVKFMGESAKILNPDKTVLMPDAAADCPMAHMVTPRDILAIRENYDDLAVVCYINSTAEIKAYSDVCVTSSNAEKIVRMLPQKNIFFVPDQHLGSYIANKLPDKNFIFHDGFCPIHARVSAQVVRDIKAKHPCAQVLMHPECPAEAVALADYVGSTSGIIDYATQSDAKAFIIATEPGVLYELRMKNPDKSFYPVEAMGVCEDMKLVTLQKVLHVLKTMDNAVELEEDLSAKAKAALVQMHELAR